jgi:hypothetical protein
MTHLNLRREEHRVKSNFQVTIFNLNQIDKSTPCQTNKSANKYAIYFTLFDQSSEWYFCLFSLSLYICN